MGWFRTPRRTGLNFEEVSSAVSPTPWLIRVSRVLSSKNVCFLPANLSKQQALGRLIAAMDLQDPTSALNAVLARERTGPTRVAPGVILPHARLDKIPRILVALGVSLEGIVDAQIPEPLHILLLFFSPSNRIWEHLAFLSSMSTLFHQKGLADSILHAHSADEAIKRIHKMELSL